MLKSYSRLLTIGVILLTILGVSLRAENRPVFSDTLKTAPEKQFVLPQKKTTGLTAGENRGKNLYQYYCAVCHGNTGNADGFNSFSVTPTPAKLSDPKLMAALSDDAIQKTIKEGGAGVGLSPHMPAWGGVFTDENISDLTHFIRTLSNPKNSSSPLKN